MKWKGEKEMEENKDFQEELEDIQENVAGETPHQKFYRISQRRIQVAAKYIDMLSNCAGPGYEYSKEDAEKMFSYLQQVLDDTKAKYEKKEFHSFSW